MSFEEQSVIFFVVHKGVERSFELPEYDIVGDLKQKIMEVFNIPPDKQIINGWKKIPKADNTILQYCGDISSVTFLTVQSSEENEDRTKMCWNDIENNTVLDDKEAAISGYKKIKSSITSSVKINTVTLADAIAECCFTRIQERKVLLLYLHNGNDVFSRQFAKNVNNPTVAGIVKNNFFVLAWDVEDARYHADMRRALDEFELYGITNLVRCKACCVLFIQNIDGCIAVNSRLGGNISDKDFLTGLQKISSLIVAERLQEMELQKLENDAGGVYDMTSSKYQKLMSDMLGDRNYDCFEHDQHEELKKKIAYAMFGPPATEEGYESKELSKVETIFLSIIQNNNEFAEFKDRVEISFIYNCTEPLASEKIARAKKYAGTGGYNPNTDLSPVPIFVLRKCHNSDNPCRIFIDDIGRVYRTWEQYLNKNKLHKCKMVLPRNGRYDVDARNEVILETHLSPACGLDIKFLEGADMVSTGAGLVSGGIFAVALIPAVTLAPAVLVTAVVVGAGAGAYAIGRSIHTLLDRSQHRETLSFANSEARGAYLNILAGSLGFVGAGANMAVSQLATRGVNIGQGAATLINTLGVANIGASGASLLNSTIDVFDQWINENQRPSFLTMVQLSSSILFFGNAVYNFRTCSTIVEESQARALKDYQDSLRSNRHRKTFNKLMKETIRQNDGNRATGRAEVIATIRKLPNKDEVFAALTRSNKEMNRRGVKFYASGGELTLNGQSIDINKFTGLNKSATSAFLAELPVKTDVTVVEVRSMQKVFSGFEVNATNMEALARYAVRLLGCYNGDVQALVVAALRDLLAFLPAAFVETLNEVFPNGGKYYNLLAMVIEFFGGVAAKLGGGGGGTGQVARLFERAVQISFDGGHLSEMALKELMDYFRSWLAMKVYDFQNDREADRSRRVHSGRPKVRAYCSICGGYSFKMT